MVRLPIVDREFPIFSDWHVDAGFGTGFVKVTPAHDPNDYAMGQAHGLPQINIFDEHAVVVEGYGEFTGMTREECREAVVAWFEEHDLLDHVDDHEHSVMHCYRCDSTLGAVVVRAMVRRRRQAQRGRQRTWLPTARSPFHPSRWTQTYMTWMETSRTGASRVSCGGATASPRLSLRRVRLGGRPHGGHRRLPRMRQS